MVASNLRLDDEVGLRAINPSRMSRMNQLLGTMPAMGMDNLSLRKTTLINLLSKSPKLAVVMSPNVHGALSAMETAAAAIKRPPASFQRKELFLGCAIIHHTGAPQVLVAKGCSATEKAHQHFAEVEHLELSARCESVLEKVARYTKVTHLTLIFGSSKSTCSF
ncbi:uncharacterized protein [Dermacentor andersoni]|uniref:uncharacterized protein isoform X3 n=1 Tax=Dermacentor andersoni TaxID=34620 RepID=UPI002417F25F|nr:uncharacterized protein LOC126534033 isoform X3 [Dermacentor andersoni]